MSEESREYQRLYIKEYRAKQKETALHPQRAETPRISVRPRGSHLRATVRGVWG